MNDTHASSDVRDALSGAMSGLAEIHMTAPLDTIVRAGQTRARRRRRRLISVTAAAAVAAVPAAVMLLPAGHHASHQASHEPTAQLAAWTVAAQAGGDVVVTIRQLRDPAGLQGTLRADGVPASVTFLAQPNPACQPYDPVPVTGAYGLAAAGPILKRDTRGVVSVSPGSSPAQAESFVIDSAALPRGVGVQIGAESSGPGQPDPARAQGWIGLQFGLVRASSGCTGS